ncbi:DUF4176 domain-containing protein [Macrococcus armenti]|uniref:DUF4176 domain-containing protein n=1 Tax=Macrococcus armenti TaxID=2875764 RepID=UPI001CD00A96|nr:DUF4176 domain-containing protein [Macrococcus armenti]UBH08873.1 DUF4176 domain-containing protein [Macrococcus armenti]
MLPIGSVIYLKDGTQKLMILNRGPIIESDQGKTIYDYSACRYPIGFDLEEIFYFNEENIDSIIFKGYIDDEEERLVDLYHKSMMNLDSGIVKGKVEN